MMMRVMVTNSDLTKSNSGKIVTCKQHDEFGPHEEQFKMRSSPASIMVKSDLTKSNSGWDRHPQACSYDFSLLSHVCVFNCVLIIPLWFFSNVLWLPYGFLMFSFFINFSWFPLWFLNCSLISYDFDFFSICHVLWFSSQENNHKNVIT